MWEREAVSPLRPRKLLGSLPWQHREGARHEKRRLRLNVSEKRKPQIVMLLRKSGKKNLKVELFNARDFRQDDPSASHKCGRYRIRVNGRWYKDGRSTKYTFLTKWQFRDLLWRSLNDKGIWQYGDK